MRQTERPSVRKLFLELIREYSIGVVPNEGDMGELLYRECKGLCTAENGITGQKYDRPGKPRLALGLDVPGLERRKVVFARADLRLSAKGNALAIAKTIDDHERNVVLPAGVVTNVDDHAIQKGEVVRNQVKDGAQCSLFDTLKLKNAHVAKFG